MNYTVVWLPVAEEQLADIWLAAARRDVIAIAAREIDRELGQQPLEAGESRDEATRILITRPLVATYHVDEADRVVRVVNVRVLGNNRRSGP